MLVTYLDPIGAFLSLLCTVSFVRVSRVAWIFGLASTILKIILYLDRGLYGQVGLKCIFVGTMVYGWYRWREQGPKHEVLSIRYLSWRERGAYILICGAGIGLVNYLLAKYTNSTVSLMDATIAIGALAGQFMLCHKIIENWFIWFFINCLSVFLYADVGLPFNAGVHFFYIFLSVVGFKQWHSLVQRQSVRP